jgi:hypothetical protein
MNTGMLFLTSMNTEDVFLNNNQTDHIYGYIAEHDKKGWSIVGYDINNVRNVKTLPGLCSEEVYIVCHPSGDPLPDYYED